MHRVSLLLVAILAAGCGDTPTAPSSAALDRLGEVEQAVRAWQQAGDLPAARLAAETASNLITGPGVVGSGDADGNGTIDGAVAVGLLPGGPGLVASPGSRCVQRDVLGGTWADPAQRWAQVQDRVTRWTPEHNLFPELPSHPQRIVGWAALAARAATLEQAREYAGHALLHVRVTREALDGC